MSSKRKWDQAGPNDADSPSKAQKVEEGKTASEAAAAAAAIAAKIAAQFAGSGGSGIHDETGASVSTKGTWYPDRSKATDKDPPLYLHISATTNEILQRAIDKVNELISMDMGSLVEDKKDRLREKRKWPEEKIPVGLDTIRNFNVRAKVVGPSGMFVKYIQQETGTRVQIKGIGSGFVDQETGQEHDEPMYIHVTGPDEGQVARAKVLTEDLLDVVRQEHAKVKTVVAAQQMELHQAQVQYAAYSAYAGYAPPQPGSAPPPPPPGEQPPPPPPDGSAPPGAAGQGSMGAAPAASDTDAYAAYWAAYGYDVNSPEFKAWQAQQQQQYAQYYAQQGYVADAGAVAPPPNDAAPPPPPPV
ncbi:hypothetical protein EW026_g1470 [Hermanssonia centrifuga]|uniref:K Homology domain-containing protein n=1 Tax=Hermanssonia centrifuga TaxID=98765 RepID=A0A4S4KS27_9APHY|nr:hypothetical protein EW026_g1470 [Hermanssonia centrifuga]